MNQTPGIPQQHHRGRPLGATWGRFVAITPTTIQLRDRANNRWTLDQVTICHGGWGFDDEGVAKLPRASVYNAAGQEVVKGDRVLILFLEGSRRRPVVIPGFRRIQATAGAFLPYHHQSPTTGDQNRLAARVQPKDATGAPIGSVDLEAGYDDKAALRVSVGPPNGGGPRTFVALDDSDGSAAVGTKDGAALRLAKGQCALVTAEGHVLIFDADNGIQLGWSKGGKPGGVADPLVVLKEGLAQILATLTQVTGRLEVTDGVTPALFRPLVDGLQSPGTGLIADLALALAPLAAISPPAGTLATKLGAIASGADPGIGYVSQTVKTS